MHQKKIQSPSTMYTITILFILLLSCYSNFIKSDYQGLTTDITRVRADCRPSGIGNGNSAARCALLNQKWLEYNSVCRPLIKGAWRWPGYNAATFVGSGCPSKCALEAKTKGLPPRAYCQANGNKPVNLGDGGCKLYFVCDMFCPDVCQKNKMCRWQGGHCVFVGVV
jgi:hypothetical protein